jgi:hypothetical protein
LAKEAEEEAERARIAEEEAEAARVAAEEEERLKQEEAVAMALDAEKAQDEVKAIEEEKE